MAKAPLYTVVNAGKVPRLAAFGGRSVPIDVGRDKALPLTAAEALALAAEGFKVSGPDGTPVAAGTAVAEPVADEPKPKAKAKD